MAKINTLGFLVLGVLFFTACKEEVAPVPQEEPKNYVKIEVDPMFDTEELYLDSVYSTIEGYDIKFSEIRFYMEDVRNGSTQLIDAGLFDYRARGTVLFRAEGKGSDFGSLQANLGVGAANNHSDPSAFPSESMLNILNANDMHWNWSPGYIFVKVEAKVDTIPDGTPLFNHNVVLHAGLDPNLQTLSFENLTWTTTGNDDVLRLKLDMSTFLNGSQVIDVKDEPSTHSAPGQEALTLKVMTNFKEALTVH
jgi:hypothetical protein